MPRRTRVRFPPARVGGLEPWAPPKFYRLRRRRRTSTLAFNVGEFDPLLGRALLRDRDGEPVAASLAGAGRAAAARTACTTACSSRCRASRILKAPERDVFDGHRHDVGALQVAAAADSVRSALDSLAGAGERDGAPRDLVDPSRDGGAARRVRRLADVAR